MHPEGLSPREVIGSAPRKHGSWRTFDGTDGLCAGVRSMIQGRHGYLWLGTGAGLCRFDGSQFVSFTTDDGLPHNYVLAVFQDSGGRLWAGTRGQGAACFEGSRFTALGPEDGMACRHVRAIAEQPAGVLWFGGLEGLIRLDGETPHALTTADGLPSDCVQVLRADRQGRLWIGTAGGLACYDKGRITVYGTSDGLPGTDVLALYEDGAGRIWAGLRHAGLACFDGERFEPRGGEALEGRSVPAICEDGLGRLWASAWNGGAVCLDGAHVTRYTTEDGLLEDRVAAIIRDADGALWLGHLNAGITCFDPVTVQRLTSDPVTETVIQDGAGRLWFGDHNRLVCFHNVIKRDRVFPDRIYALLEDKSGALWVATKHAGLFRFEAGQDPLSAEAAPFTTAHGLPSNTVLSLLETRDGAIWAGTGGPGSLCRFDGEGFEAVATPHEGVFRLLEDSRGRLWLGGFGESGLSCYDGAQLLTYAAQEGLPGDRVQSLLEDGAGTLWVGTQQNLCRFDGAAFATLAQQHGLVGQFHQCAAHDAHGQLWFGTLLGGIYRSDGQHFQRMTKAEGLPSNSVTGLLPQADGSMIIGTYRGIVHYRPTAMTPPRVVITEVVAGEVHVLPEEVALTTRQADVITIAFVGFSLSTQKVRYTYILDGHDEDLEDTWDTQVRYENLPVGEYEFRVAAINRDLVASEKPAVVRLRVLPDPLEQRQLDFEAELRRMERQLELTDRVSKQNEALVELARSRKPESGGLIAALQEITERAAHLLDVERVSVWLYSDDRAALRCVDLYERSRNVHSDGGKISVANYPAYFSAIESCDVIAADDVQNDARTREFKESTLQPLSISSAINAVIRLGNQTVGVVHHAHVGPARRWALEEEHFALTIAELVAETMEACERTRSEDALRKSESRYRSILENMQEGYYEVDLEGAFVFFNEACCTLLGRPPEQLAAANLFEACFDGDGAEKARKDFARVLHTEEPAKGLEWRVTRGDGADREIQASVALLRDAKQAPVGFHGVLSDNTERKLAEAMRAELEEKIRHAQKLDSLSVLAEGLAHDFNNLLMGLLGNADRALAELPEDAKVRQRLERIHKAGLKASELTHQMLAYSGKGKVSVRPLNLTRLVIEMEELLRKAVAPGAQLKLNLADELFDVAADDSQVRQVLLALVTNASEALIDGEGEISVSTGTMHADHSYLADSYTGDELPEGHYAYIEVEDSGCGIEPSLKARIFDPFFSTKFLGRGLGLAALLGIVRGHRGAVKVYSKPGVGSTFKVLFPSTQTFHQGISAGGDSGLM